MDEIEQTIKLHNEKIKELAKLQYAAELRNKIKAKIEAANNVVEYTAHPELAGYNQALKEVLEMLGHEVQQPDPGRVLAAIQMGFSKERPASYNYNPYME